MAKMGRPKEIEEGVRLAVYLDSSQIQKLDYFSKKAGISKSRLLRNLVEVGLDEMSTMDAIGILTFVRKIEMAREAIGQAFSGGATPVEA